MISASAITSRRGFLEKDSKSTTQSLAVYVLSLLICTLYKVAGIGSESWGCLKIVGFEVNEQALRSRLYSQCKEFVIFFFWTPLWRGWEIGSDYRSIAN